LAAAARHEVPCLCESPSFPCYGYPG
jgi:hypothetical protein